VGVKSAGAAGALESPPEFSAGKISAAPAGDTELSAELHNELHNEPENPNKSAFAALNDDE
jgi:hypothetical protein